MKIVNPCTYIKYDPDCIFFSCQTFCKARVSNNMITLNCSLLCLSVPVNHDGERQRAQYQDPETEATKWNLLTLTQLINKQDGVFSVAFPSNRGMCQHWMCFELKPNRFVVLKLVKETPYAQQTGSLGNWCITTERRGNTFSLFLLACCPTMPPRNIYTRLEPVQNIHRRYPLPF